jgi:hypothetical protein
VARRADAIFSAAAAPAKLGGGGGGGGGVTGAASGSCFGIHDVISRSLVKRLVTVKLDFKRTKSFYIGQVDNSLLSP